MTFTLGLVVALFLPPARPPSLQTVLARAGDSAAIFHRDFRQLVADESYVQDLGGRQGLKMLRSTRSEFAMVADEADARWYGLRDVFEVNGKALPTDTRGRLERALLDTSAAGLTEARRIGYESASHLLAGSGRAANTPTFPLMVLLPAHQARFAFSKVGEKRVGDVTVWVISYREIQGPMFFRAVDGRQVPMTGEFWVEPDSGIVFRAQYVVDSTDAVHGTSGQPDRPRLEATVDFSRMSVEVTYRVDPALGASVPIEMREIFSREVETGGGGMSIDTLSATHFVSVRLSCVATYANVRRVVAPAPQDASGR